MKEYTFFQHKKCEFFPCHTVSSTENFNCLFCYCPLYALGRECGGNFYFNSKGKKVCTECTFVHQRENYPLVIERLKKLVERISEEKE